MPTDSIAVITSQEFEPLKEDEDLHPYVEKPVTNGDIKRVRVGEYASFSQHWKVGTVRDYRDEEWSDNDWELWVDHYEGSNTEQTEQYELKVVEPNDEVKNEIQELFDSMEGSDEMKAAILKSAVQDLIR